MTVREGGEMPEVLTVEQVARMLGFHPESIRRLAREEKIPAVKVRNKWRFLRDVIIDWIAAGCPDPKEMASAGGPE